jgi:hypothetical protein
VPVQAIFRQGPVAFVYVQDGAGFAQRQVELGRASELNIEITKGLVSGDKVLLREPKAFEITAKLDASVFEMANASAPNFSPPPGGDRPPMNASPAEGAGAPASVGSGEGPRRGPRGGGQGGGGQGGGGGRNRPDGSPRQGPPPSAEQSKPE